MKKFIVLMTMLMMVLSVASPAFAMHPAERVEVTGRLAEIADHPYATHGMRDEASGTEYLLKSDAVDLYSYLGQRVNVYGAYASAYASSVSGDMSAAQESGEDGPRLVNVTRVEPASIDDPIVCDEYLPNGEPNPDAPECPVVEPPEGEVTVTFELTIDGEVPEGRILAVDTGIQDVAHPVFCSTTTYSSR